MKEKTSLSCGFEIQNQTALQRAQRSGKITCRIGYVPCRTELEWLFISLWHGGKNVS
ncbi:hypothetical protein D3OALGA1CA_4593 [Olavius algarvensis associated proteobacterium Delta 3]|nr:hypothetical protein D3OALGB2SA_4006 [Olavius algarvensis associated proteobacterium Delta 3]CAB5153875.1 hypothetical protein D3OALGA1CA_4593 [Olavius algarvensis associated proteobacterium Delta 3]